MRPYGFFTKLKYSLSRKKVCAPKRAGEIVFASYNIRFFNDDRDQGKKHWYCRAPYCLKNMETLSADIFCFQEVKPPQFAFLTRHLSGYDSVVRYRDDAPNSEACPIFFSKERFELLDSGTFWLSETPDHVSKSWGSTHNRIATFAKLRDRDGKEFTVYNVHPDYVVEDTRIRQLKVLADKMEERGGTVILAGDFNAVKGEPCLLPFEEKLCDSKDFLGKTFGATFNGFGTSEEDDVTQGIDFIFLPKDATVVETDVLKTVFNGVYPSDHYPIYARFAF